MVPRSQAEDSLYADEAGRLNDQLVRQREERKQLQSQIDGLVSVDARRVAELNLKVGAAAGAVAEARQALRRAADRNQIYRLAASWYGVSTSDVTAEQFATARWVFATFSAVAVALAGSIAALVYYARTRVPGAPSLIDLLVAKLARARRAYYARLRKPLKIQVAGPERVIYREGREPPVIIEKIIEKYVDRWRDQIVLIPRWGIKAPLHVNALIGGAGFSAGPTDSSPANVNSNIMPLKKMN
jgi:hypothetical protein